MLFQCETKRATWPKSGAVLLMTVSLVINTGAELPTARLFTIFPTGGKIGTTFEVTISGNDLDEATHLHFSATNISSTPRTNETSGGREANKFIVTIGSNAPLGTCDVRVRGRFGI